MESKSLLNRLLAIILDIRFLQIAAQAIFVIVVVTVTARLTSDMLSELARRDLTPNFTFLANRAGFEIGESQNYTPDDSFGDAFIVGLTNTIRVVAVALVGTTILGVFVGIFLLSGNWLVRNIARVYVEILRNTPLLVQLFVWFYVVILALPPIRQSMQLPAEGIVVIPLRWLLYLIGGIILILVALRISSADRWRLLAGAVVVVALAEVFRLLPNPIARFELAPIAFLSNRGVAVPQISTGSSFGTWLAFVGLGLALAAGFRVYGRRMSERTGLPVPRGLYSVLIVVALAVIGWLAVSSPLAVAIPGRQGLRFANGAIFSPEYLALLLGLVVYTSAFIAEIVRAGIQAVPHGQIEASRALGFSYPQLMRLIVLPQALRVIIPPLGNQYLNLAKNSSLAIAIAYADLFQVTNTIMNQSGQSVSGMIMVIVAYLVMSLLIATAMNLVNRRFQLGTR
jgi:general L-amino acid transport system permease protein